MNGPGIDTAATEARPVIQLAGVSFAYGPQPVLEDVDLCLHERDFVCLLGPNGGGKTTLLKLILGLLEPQRGTVRVFGAPPAAVRDRLGYVPQHFRYDPDFPIRVLDVVLTGRLCPSRWAGRYSAADHAAAIRALEQVEMAELRERSFAALSGGQRQRVLIARALTSEPQILLLDEPTSNVDLRAEGELHHLLAGLKQRLTILLVSHDLGFVSQLVTRVACVNRRVVAHPTSEITGELILQTYGRDVRLVRHDHHCTDVHEHAQAGRDDRAKGKG